MPGKTTFQGVEYAASAADWGTTGSVGSDVMASHVRQALKQCPKTKVFLSGYSQGAMMPHKVFSYQHVPADQVTGVVVFGDTIKSSKFPLPDNRVKEYCAEGDPVCLNGSNVMAHITYGNDVADAAKFVQGVAYDTI
ncbi:alpha/beta-hydrolase [Mytilinidion resinicola]|uniref:cutinase n=1 Tax=Mytilinidion resinicola TaxID=574789 RepID=A0A6A6YD60_9PEZI|nr:alpha/beta-hydrolase [Mytilinidion resinicola]KAF2805777.1 alpha/beta-hydrolase [Mytilinidion resinicola]